MINEMKIYHQDKYKKRAGWTFPVIYYLLRLCFEIFLQHLIEVMHTKGFFIVIILRAEDCFLLLYEFWMPVMGENLL